MMRNRQSILIAFLFLGVTIAAVFAATYKNKADQTARVAQTAQAANTPAFAQQTAMYATVHAAGTRAKAQEATAEAASTLASVQQATAIAQENSAATAEARALEAQNNIDSQRLVFQSIDQLHQNHWELAMLLAIEAGRAADTQEANNALAQALNYPGVPSIILPGEEAQLAKWSYDSQRVLTIDTDGTARIWDVGTETDLASFQTEKVTNAEWNRTGSRILTWSDDNTLRLWNAQSGSLLAVIPTYKLGIIYRLAWNPTGDRILIAGCEEGNYVTAGCMEGQVSVWNTDTGVEIFVLPGIVASWNPAGDRILSIILSIFNSYKGTIKIWDAGTGSELLTFDHTNPFTNITWNPDGSRVFISLSACSWGIGCEDYGAEVYDTQTGHRLFIVATLENHQTSWSADGKNILTFGYGVPLEVWDASTGKKETTIPSQTEDIGSSWLNMANGQFITQISHGYSRNGRYDLIYTLIVWDTTTGKLEFALPQALVGYVSSLIWSTDGSYFATVNEEDRLQIWDARSGTALTTLYEGRLLSAAWDSQGHRLLAIGTQGKAWIWDADNHSSYYEQKTDEVIEKACQQVFRNMHVDEWERFFPNQPYRESCPQLSSGG